MPDDTPDSVAPGHPDADWLYEQLTGRTRAPGTGEAAPSAALAPEASPGMAMMLDHQVDDEPVTGPIPSPFPPVPAFRRAPVSHTRVPLVPLASRRQRIAVGGVVIVILGLGAGVAYAASAPALSSESSVDSSGTVAPPDYRSPGFVLPSTFSTPGASSGSTPSVAPTPRGKTSTRPSPTPTGRATPTSVPSSVPSTTPSSTPSTTASPSPTDTQSDSPSPDPGDTPVDTPSDAPSDSPDPNDG